jgi:hypothetical protein
MHELLASMFAQHAPVLGDVIWIGGGGLGLVILIIIIVLVLRR